MGPVFIKLNNFILADDESGASSCLRKLRFRKQELAPAFMNF